jgi:hypothetical protein
MKNIYTAFFVSMALSACGGGGGGDPVSSSPIATPVAANQAPVASAGTAQLMFLGTITLNGSFSKDPEGSALTYKWALTSRPAGSQAVLSSSTAMSPTFTADVPGDYLATLVVNDGRVDSAPSTVNVNASVESTWSVTSSVNELTGAQQQVLTLGSFSIICFGTSNTIVYTTSSLTASGSIAYKVGNEAPVYETWNESPSTGYKQLRAGGFNMALVQKLYQDTDFTFQYSAHLTGLQTSVMKSKNMYVAIEKTRAVCKWPTDIFPVKK